MLPLLAALALPTVGLAGIPEKFKGNQGSDKWVQISKNWTLNTEEVQLKRDKLIFMRTEWPLKMSSKDLVNMP